MSRSSILGARKRVSSTAEVVVDVASEHQQTNSASTTAAAAAAASSAVAETISNKSKVSDKPKKATVDNASSDSGELDTANARTPMLMMDPKTCSAQQDGLMIQNKRHYTRLYAVSQIVAGVLLLFMLIWIFKYLNGIGFSTSAVTFNFHPLLMTIGFIILYSNSMLIYRTLRTELKKKLKLIHTILNGAVMLVSMFGSISVFYFHQKNSIPHFYSLHSWLGISTWLLFISQFTTGFVTFMFPGASYTIRQTMMPFHRFIGVATFVLGCATCLTGLNEKAIFSLRDNPKYSDLPAAGIWINVIGLVLALYAALVVYLVSKTEYIRRPLPEEQVINLNFDLSSNN